MAVTKFEVSLSGGRIVTVIRGKLKPETEKKKSSKPANHDIAMACVCWSWMDPEGIAKSILKLEAVEHVSITEPGGLVYDFCK